MGICHFNTQFQKYKCTVHTPPPFQKVMLQSIHNSVLKKSCLKVQNLQYNFWIEINPPPPLLPLELFRKFIRFEDAGRPLTRKQMYHIEMCVSSLSKMSKKDIL